MPPKNHLLISSLADAQNNIDLENETARLAISEDNTIAFANNAFCKKYGIDDDNFDRIDTNILFKKNKTQAIRTLKNGTYFLYLSKKPTAFAFEWITTPDKKRYFVGSETQDEPSPSDTEKINKPDDLEIFHTLSDDVLIVTDKKGSILASNRNDIDIKDKKFPIKPRKKPFEAQISINNSEKRFFQWSHTQIKDKHYFRGRDITDMRQQREALNDREKKLLQAESLARMGHWRWSMGQDSVEWSDEIYSIFGVDQSFKPTLDSITAMVHKRDVARANQALQRAILEKNDYDIEFRIARPDGAFRYIHCEGRCALDHDGDAVALYGIMQDITERRLYEQQLREAKDAAEQAYNAKSQFLTNMSHELRTPLNAIIGFSEMIKGQVLGPVHNEKYIEYADGIWESGRHLLDLIGDILDMSKIEAGKYELALEEFGLHETLRSSINMIDGRARESGITVSVTTPPNENLKIIADRRGVRQIFLNILSNAVKFTEDGGHVRVDCFERGDYVILKVQDDGIGIPANKLATITRPFEQVSHSYARDHEGSGLGLAITKELVEMHGGNLSIESHVDIGTTVTIRLPYDASRT